MHPVFLRIGSLAEIHAATATGPLARGRRVIARTGRGIELGEVIGPCGNSRAISDSSVTIVRATTQEDELLIRRLDRHKRQAVEACRTALAESGSPACLLDVDQIFDGGTLVMHFLGPVDDIAASVTKAVAEKYESIVRSRHFAKLLSDGCGPDCGTAEGGGCGTSCSGCAIAAACK
ncbi:hypothetical protein [Rubripirellula reticaptiva]|uniref:PSP1 C-terminal domain-containing protein n=1 Tax=Rubripirellula reticaptiva TaxID=2528013 RepID=A0A5C6ELG3_9BACT|nr:hypothetical protein [Rubripirellula reticaptiva]TWU48421.1 hypothetical protein Poly59_52690 [Rubripirellula reticaptiva]